MKIISLKRKGNDVVIILEDGSFIKIDYRTFVDFKLHKDFELNEDLIELLSKESSFVKAKDSAFRLLARRLHSKKELKQKLQKKKYPLEVIEKVIDDFSDKSYLNDDEFAKLYAAEKIKKGKTGINKLQSELSKRGINKKVIQDVINEIDSENYFISLKELAEKKLEQLKKKETDKRKLSSKLASHLASKGYEFDLIYKIIRELDLDNEE